MEGIKDVCAVITPMPLKITLPDPSDMPFLEVDVTSRADYLVTGNKRHFPARLCKGVKVVTPAELMKIFMES